jgi:glucose dehydrogenase
MVAGKLLLLSVPVIAILVLSTLFAALPITPRASAQAQQLPREQRNWEYTNHNILATNSNPQNQINTNNVQLLELKWIYPFPVRTLGLIGGYTAIGLGGPNTPLIVDGIAYTADGQGNVFAIDMGTGKNLWTFSEGPLLNKTQDLKRLRGSLIEQRNMFHFHGFNYAEGKLFLPSPPCDVMVIDALTGKLVKRIQDTCDVKTIPGAHECRGYKVQSYGPEISTKHRVMLVKAGAVDESNLGCRAFMSAYNLDTYQRMWVFFFRAPLGGDKDWFTKVADKGWVGGKLVPTDGGPVWDGSGRSRQRVQEIFKASDVVAKCRECVENDWGNAIFDAKLRDGSTVRSAIVGGAAPGWGQHAVDEEAGIIYVATAQASPDWNATYRPGPNIYSAAILAIDLRTGDMKWWFQSIPHDLWDYDCAWNVALTQVQGKKAVVKACKNGVLYALDAATGAPIWHYVGEDFAYTEFVCKSAAGGCLLDPMSKDDMRKPWQNYPSTAPFFQNPPGSGGFESDVTIARGKVFVAGKNDPGHLRIIPVGPDVIGNGNVAVPPPFTQKNNATLYALDLNTGKRIWKSVASPTTGFLGGVIEGGGVIFTPGPDGIWRFYEADTGKLLSEKFFGIPLNVPNSMGADAKGKMRVMINGGSGRQGGAVPGSIMAYGLPDKLPEPQIVTKEVIKEVIKEVPKEVVKEVIKEVPKEVTKTVTVETVSPISYAAIGIGVVLVVIAGVLFTRRKKA